MSPEEEKPKEKDNTGEDAGGQPAASASGSPSAAQASGNAPSRLVGVLTGVCVIAGMALAGGHAATNRRIAQARYRFKLASVKKVLPPCENDPGGDTVDVTLPGGAKTTVYRCRKNGKIVAVAFSLDSQANKNAPYSGTIELLIGIDTSQDAVVHTATPKRVGVLVLKHSETPGLGAKIEDYAFRKQYGLRKLDKQGRSCVRALECRNWAVTKDDAVGFVDAISGATISSRAVTEIVRRAMEQYNKPAVRAEMTRPSSKDEPAAVKPQAGAAR